MDAGGVDPAGVADSPGPLFHYRGHLRCMTSTGVPMLYLLTHHSEVRWCALPAQLVLAAVSDHGADLARLDWQTSELPRSDNDLRVALRHGVPCSTGLVVDGGRLHQQRQADLIRNSRARAGRTQTSVRPHDATMERLFPGWTEGSQQLDQRIAESHHRAVHRAEGAARAELAKPVDQALADHWTRLGGTLPNPV